MKIAIICFNLRWQAGGTRLIFSEAQALEKLGHKVVIYAPDFDRRVYPELWSGLEIRRVESGARLFWQYTGASIVRRVKEKLAHEKGLIRLAGDIARSVDGDFDVVNLHDFAYIAAPFLKSKLPKARVVWTMNEPPYQYLPKEAFLYDFLSRAYNFYKDLSARKYFRAIHGVAVLVNRYKKWAEERGMRARVIRSGLDFQKFYSPPKSIAGKSKFKILSVGALNRYRRFEDTVRAAKILREAGFDVRLQIVAKNIWKEDAYQKELTEFVEKESMKDFTELNFAGVSEAELPRVYANADFFVLPMYLPPPRSGYGWQMVGFEAMAAGTPTIVCRALDVTEVLKDGETAAFHDPASPGQIADKIREMLNNPDLYSKISRQGQEFVKNNLSWGKYAREFLELCASQ